MRILSDIVIEVRDDCDEKKLCAEFHSKDNWLWLCESCLQNALAALRESAATGDKT